MERDERHFKKAADRAKTKELALVAFGIYAGLKMARTGQKDENAEALDIHLDAAINHIVQASEVRGQPREFELKQAKAALREAIRLGSATPRY